MNVAVAYHLGDYDAACRWIEHTNRFDHSRHDLFLMPSRDIEHAHCPKPAGWRTMTNLKDGLGIRSNWHTDLPTRSAAGPNSAFRQFARHFHANKLGEWFFCEPDAILLCSDALDRLEAEYIASRKSYMGAIEMRPFKHITGNAIYPENAAMEERLILPMKFKGVEVAFDLAGAKTILPRCHVTNLIQHEFRAPPFSSREDFNARVRKDAVIFHACKDGSIYQFLKTEPNQDGKRKGWFRDKFQAQADAKIDFSHPGLEFTVTHPVNQNGIQAAKGADENLPEANRRSIAGSTPARSAKRKRGKRVKIRTPEQQSAMLARMAKARAARGKKKITK